MMKNFENEYPTRFINKNLEAFLHFIVIFLLHENEINESDDSISKIIQKIKIDFEKIDSSALNSQENWWPTILEQIEAGIM